MDLLVTYYSSPNWSRQGVTEPQKNQNSISHMAVKFLQSLTPAVFS